MYQQDWLDDEDLEQLTRGDPVWRFSILAGGLLLACIAFVAYQI